MESYAKILFAMLASPSATRSGRLQFGQWPVGSSTRSTLGLENRTDTNSGIRSSRQRTKVAGTSRHAAPVTDWVLVAGLLGRSWLIAP